MYKLIVLFSTVFLLCTFPLLAHPPSSLTVNYNPENDLLTVGFQHQVNNNADHYIYDAVVKLNKKVIVHQSMNTQDTQKGGNLVYKIINLKPKDKIEVTLKCIKYGANTGTLIIK